MNITSLNPKLIKKFVSTHWLDLAVVTLLIIFSFIIWWPTRYLPFWWDAAGFAAQSANQILESGFWPLVTQFSDFAHPPLLMLLLASAWKIFGQTLLVSHLVMLPFLPILLISTYAIARTWLKPISAIVATFLTALTPIVIAEYGQIYLDLPAAALSTMALAFFVHNNKRAALIIFTLAVMTKATVLLLLPLFLGIWYLAYQKDWKTQKNDLVFFALPITTLSLWFLHHYNQLGWAINRPGRSIAGVTNLEQVIWSTWYVIQSIFIHQGRWLITGAATLGLILVWYEKRHAVISDKLRIIILTLGLAIFAHAISGEFALRYGLYLIPILYIAVVWTLETVSPILVKPTNAFTLLAIVGIISGLGFVSHWRPVMQMTDRYELSPPSDLSFQDSLQVFRQAAIYLQITSPNALIYGGFPENQQLTIPFLGYVNRPLNYSPCQEFTLMPDSKQIIYVHPYSPSQYPCLQLIQQVEADRLDQFESGGKWVELYQVTATQSATLTPPQDSI